MKRFLIITANVGEKDFTKSPEIKFDNCDYLYFTDTPSPVEGWDVLKSYRFSSIDMFSSRRNAKVYKVLGPLLFHGYEYIIWQDANHCLIVNPEEIIMQHIEFDLLLFPHPHRRCVYDEMSHVASLGVNLDILGNIKSQYSFYEKEGMPKGAGLHEMTTFIVKTGFNVNELMLMWWEQICKFSSRDQFSFDFCLWRMRGLVTVAHLDGYANMYAGGNKFFTETTGHKI